jgi:hypothetical protein
MNWEKVPAQQGYKDFLIAWLRKTTRMPYPLLSSRGSVTPLSEDIGNSLLKTALGSFSWI